jgi:hypothetical protein
MAGGRTRLSLMVAVSVALLAGCAGRPQEVAGPVLTPCGLAVPTGSDLQVRCAELAVPEAADQTAGPSLQLHVVVVRSSTAAERRPAPDPVVALAPSAGQAASAVPLGLATLVRLTLVRDLVLVDQRGTGGLHPLQLSTQDLVGSQPEHLVGRDPAAFTHRAPVIRSLERRVTAHTDRLPLPPLVRPSTGATLWTRGALPLGGWVIQPPRPFQHRAQRRPHDASEDAQHALLVLGQTRLAMLNRLLLQLLGGFQQSRYDR